MDHSGTADPEVCGGAAQKVLTKEWDASASDQTGREAEEDFVDVGTSFPADTELAETVEPGNVPFHDPLVDAEVGGLQVSAAADHGFDTSCPDQAAAK
ncbi:hypothetical protein ABZ318_24335 [Streptomyces sp. NPDC006197]|uniref:hypothetical protein n=1 Tax=Streptomyces sp. NPDC006197 TaxID=3156685 RepID=UPI0033B1E9EB